MKKILYLGIGMLLFAHAAVVLIGCATGTKKTGDAAPESRIFNRPYDKVWEAVKELILVDLGCVEKEINQKKGVIETVWASRITTEGTLRWRIKAEVKKKNTATLVTLRKDVQVQDEEQKTARRFKEKSKDESPNAGWKNTDADRDSVAELYQKLENKLK